MKLGSGLGGPDALSLFQGQIESRRKARRGPLQFVPTDIQEESVQVGTDLIGVSQNAVLKAKGRDHGLSFVLRYLSFEAPACVQEEVAEHFSVFRVGLLM